MNFLLERAVFRPRNLTLELTTVLVLHVLDQHHELRPGAVHDGPVARVEGGGDVVDGEELRDRAGEMVAEPGNLSRQHTDQTQSG